MAFGKIILVNIGQPQPGWIFCNFQFPFLQYLKRKSNCTHHHTTNWTVAVYTCILYRNYYKFLFCIHPFKTHQVLVLASRHIKESLVDKLFVLDVSLNTWGDHMILFGFFFICSILNDLTCLLCLSNSIFQKYITFQVFWILREIFSSTTPRIDFQLAVVTVFIIYFGEWVRNIFVLY